MDPRWARTLRGLGQVARAAGLPNAARALRGASQVDLEMLGEGDDGATARRIPVRTIGDRVAILRNNLRAGAHYPPIIDLARRIVSQQCGTPQAPAWCIAPNDNAAEVRAFHRFTRWNVRYGGDPVDLDLYAHPRHNLRQKFGDCDEQQAVMGSLCGAVGIVCYIVTGWEYGAPTWNHVWIEASCKDGQRIVSDTSLFDEAGLELGNLKARHVWAVW